jgi:CBS domain-containing protein
VKHLLHGDRSVLRNEAAGSHMTNRELAYIVKDQKPLVLPADEAVRLACRCMWERRNGSVLVVDGEQRLSGIFTGRDAVRLLAKGKDAARAPLAKAMTRKPVTITPKSRAIDALRAMAEGGFRHVPVTEEGTIKGVVSRGDIKGMEFEEFRWQYSGPQRGSGATFRTLSEVIEGRRPLVAAEDQTVQHACRSMWRRKCGCTLVIDKGQHLSGIFTGRDAVRVLATAEDAAATRLKEAMTSNPVTLTPESSAIDALRAMDDGGFRHLPVIDNGRILGVVSRGDFTGIEIDRLDEEEHLKEAIW